MGFNVTGPTRRVRASNVDDGDAPRYDILAMPREYGLNCPQLEKLNQRFYDSTTVCFAEGHVNALRDELARLIRAYRERREPELILEHGVRARHLDVRNAIVEKILREDKLYRTLEQFRTLCDEAIGAEADVQSDGD